MIPIYKMQAGVVAACPHPDTLYLAQGRGYPALRMVAYYVRVSRYVAWIDSMTGPLPF